MSLFRISQPSLFMWIHFGFPFHLVIQSFKGSFVLINNAQYFNEKVSAVNRCSEMLSAFSVNSNLKQAGHGPTLKKRKFRKFSHIWQ